MKLGRVKWEGIAIGAVAGALIAFLYMIIFKHA